MRRLPRATAALGLLVAATVPAQAPVELVAEDGAASWYRVELLVFRHTAPGAGDGEAWPPYPSLSYPERYRFLLDRERADRRLAYYPRAESRVDGRGLQRIDIEAPPPLRDPNAPLLSEAEWADLPLEPTRPDGQLGAATGADAGPEAAPDPNAPPPLPPAFVPLTTRELPASRLARGPYEVLWHEAWLQPVAEPESALPLVLDRSGDADSGIGWPRLQGSVRLYLSRYLHLETDLWLNTDGAYFPEGWRGEAPPRAPPSLLLAVPEGYTLAEGSARAVLLPALPATAGAAVPWEVPALDLDALGAPPPLPGDAVAAGREPWTWRHAVALKAQRRMRGGETHYLDHPLLGVVVRVQPLDEDALADWGTRLLDPAWDARHGRGVDVDAGASEPPAGR